MSTATETNRPKIQIDNEIREMTDEELEKYEAFIADAKPLPSPE